MANKKLWLVMLVMVLALGMAVIGCDNGNNNSDLNGTWNATVDMGDPTPVQISMVLDNGNFTISILTIPMMKGTYTTDGNNMSMITTHMYDMITGEWYTKAQVQAQLEAEEMPPEMIEAELDEMFPTQNGTYTLNGNTLVANIMDQEVTFTRQ